MVNEGELKEIKKLVFSTGDAYIVDDENKIWIWLGSKCSVDEKGTAAINAKLLDDERGGSAKIITVDQGDELAEFLSLVSGVKIVNKNLAKSMLVDVSTGSYAGHEDHVNTLYRISSEEFDGLDSIKYLQVPFEKSSLDSEDAFIADLGDFIWVWQGKTCNVKEKVMSGKFAREFDAERAGAQEVKIFEESDDDSEFLGIFEGKIPKKENKNPDLKLEADDQELAAKAAAEAAKKEEEVAKAAAEAAKKEEEVAKTAAEAAKKEEEVAKVAAEAAKKEEVKKEVPKMTEKRKAPSMPSSRPSSGVLVQKGGGRIACPKCGNPDPRKRREVKDMTKLINDYPPIYAKKFVCGKCGVHWRVEN